MPLRIHFHALLSTCLGMCLGFAPLQVVAADLPVPAEVFVTSGEAYYRERLAEFESRAVIDQISDRVILNWEEFNIAEGNKVTYVQPRDVSVALNRIMQQSPSQILGALETRVGSPGASAAEIDAMPLGGQIYLINPNGFIFGRNARVNTNTLLASALNISDEVFNETGLAGAIDTGSGIAALTAVENTEGEILIEHGAEIITTEGGRIFLFAPEIVNEGELKTPGGQVLLGASSESVYLRFPEGSDLRGFTVELTAGGTVSNLGEIVAERGNVTLAGLLLEQQGVVRATTTNDENGSVRLYARDGVRIQRTSRGNIPLPVESGTLLIGEGSVTEVLPEVADASTTIDAKPVARSRIELMGKSIEIGNDARVRAPGSELTITATVSPASTNIGGLPPSDASLTIAAGAVIDVSGTDGTVLPMSRNQVDLDLRSNELADSPLQRDGAAQGQPVSVDARRGSEFADVQAAIDNIGRTVEERLSPGGEVLIQTEGSATIEDGAVVDISGGQVAYEAGFISTSNVISAGRVVNIESADADQPITAVVSGATKNHTDWGVTEVFQDTTGTADARFEDGYVEGKDAGTLTVLANELDFQGGVVADVKTSRYQRQAPAPLGSESALVRHYEQIPQAGSMALRINGVRDVEIGHAEESLAAEPAAEILLPPDLLTDSGLGAFALTTLGDFILDTDVALLLPGGFEFSVSAADIYYDGVFDSPSGAFSLLANSVSSSEQGNLRFGNNARVLTSGTWVNDYPFLNGVATDPIWLSGGSISLQAEGDLILASTAALSADGGVWQRGESDLLDGSGGAILLRSFGIDRKFVITPQLSAVGLFEGGTLTLEANSLAVYQRDVLTPVFVGPLPGEEEFPVPLPFEELDFIPKVDAYIPSYLLRSAGFENIAIGSNRYGVTVVDGQSINLRQVNYRLLPGYLTRPSARRVFEVARGQVLPDFLRRPVNLELYYDVSDAAGGSFDPRSGVILQPGSRLSTDPGGVLSLRSSGNVWLDAAELIAPGGQVSLTVTRPKEAGVFNPGQSIRLAAGSLIDVSGVFVQQPDEVGLLRGQLFDGGHVQLTTEHGFVVVEDTWVDDESGAVVAPATIDVGGTLAELDIPVEDPNRFVRVERASNAGSIGIRSAEGGVLAGRLVAQSDRYVSEVPFGGELEIVVNGNARLIDSEVLNSGFSDTERVLALVNSTRAIDFAYGDPIPDELVGRLEVVPQQLGRANGFDAVVYRADYLQPVSGVLEGADGVLSMETDLEISLARNLGLYAPVFQFADELDVALRVPYLAMGYDDIVPEIEAPVAGGAARLVAEAEHIDLIGRARTRGAGSVRLVSDGDIRLMGQLSDYQGRDIVGELGTAGDLTLIANQIYPTTLTHFEISVGGAFQVMSSGEPDSPLLSYGGVVEVLADSIHLDGLVAAPGGQILLDAAVDITVAAGGTLTTEIVDDIVLVGQTQAGIDWIYTLPNSQLRILESLEPAGIRLQSDEVRTEEGSLLTTAGGGDILAYEFVSGPGGSVDFLAAENIGDTFVILPEASLGAAPFDLYESSQFSYSADASVILNGLGEFAGGEFVIAPPRYALLPDALLVTPIPELIDLVPGEVRFDQDGFPIVAGRFSTVDSEAMDQRWSGFKIQPGSFASLSSEYILSSGNQFFAGTGSRPVDGGSISVNAATSLNLDGSAFARAALNEDGSAAGVDGRMSILARQLAVIADLEMAIAGYSNILDAQLAEFEVGDLILGASLVAAEEDGGQLLDVAAERVVVAEGSRITQRGLTLAAQDTLTIEANTRIEAQNIGSEDRSVQLSLPADAAALVVSRDRLELMGEGTSQGTSSVLINQEATLTSTGTIAVQTAQAELDGPMQVSDGRFQLVAGAVTFSDDETLPGAISSEQLAQLDAAELAFATEVLTFDGAFDLSGEAIEVDTGRIRGDADVSFEGMDVRLRNSRFDAGSLPEPPGDATLTIQAGTVSIEDGRTTLDGFAEVHLNGAQRVFGVGDAAIATGANVRIATPELTVDTAASLDIEGGQEVEVSGTGTEHTASEPVGLGGAISVAGDTVVVDGTIRSNSGSISVTASSADGGGVHLTDRANLDVSGVSVSGAFDNLATPGGDVRLVSVTDVTSETGSRVDVSGPEAGGVLIVRADRASLAGMLDGSGGADFTVVAEQIDGLSGLNAALAEGDFSGERTYRQGSGDLRFSSDDRLHVVSFAAVAEEGSILFEGELVIGESGQGRMSARDLVSFSGTGVGDLALEAVADQGQVAFLPDSHTGEVAIRISDAGDPDGRVRVAANSGSETSVEVSTRYEVLDGVLDETDHAAIEAALTLLDASEGSIREALDLPDGVALRFGAWVVADSDLRLSGRLDLASWRFADQPGRLLVTSAGDLELDGVLSDGFRESPLLPGLPLAVLQDDESWGYELVAGADLQGADPHAVVADAGSFLVRSGGSARTGTGDILVRSGGDFSLEDQTATLYTTGIASPFFDEQLRVFDLNNVEFPVEGGALDIRTIGDIYGAATDQLLSPYMARFGGEAFIGDLPTLYGPSFSSFTFDENFNLIELTRFEQNLGVFGGGNVYIHAGGDIHDLSVIAPEIVRHVGDAGTDEFGRVVYTDNSYIRSGGDSYQVAADGSIFGGLYYAGAGTANVQAADHIGAGSNGLGAIGVTSSASLSFQARNDLLLETVFDPGVITQDLGVFDTLQSFDYETYFFTYTPDTSLHLASTVGAVVFSLDTSGLTDSYRMPSGLDASERELILNIMPGTLAAYSAGGDVSILGSRRVNVIVRNPGGQDTRETFDGGIFLFPAASGGVSLTAAENVLGGPDESSVLVSDTDVNLLPGLDRPQADLISTANGFNKSTNQFHAMVPVHANDPVPSTIEAIRGSIDAPNVSLQVGEPLRVVAADELSVFQIQTQHANSENVTVIQSGADVSLLASRNPDTGQVLSNSRGIEVAGPGQLQIIAGRSVDLGTSEGIETTGNLGNPALPDDGASVLVQTGNADVPMIDRFLEYLVELEVDVPDTDDPAVKRAYVAGALNAVLSAAGEEASVLTAQEATALQIADAFLDGFIAIETLFPVGKFIAEDDDFIFQSQGQAEGGVFDQLTGDEQQTLLARVPEELKTGDPIESTFTGDVSLFFSKINTLDGGDIDLLVPGGLLNVGLTVEFGRKDPSELGIVAQGRGDVSIFADSDVEVNRSRIFTLNGGDISIWSTNGDIDAGRGAKTALATPPLVASLGVNDTVVKVVPPNVAGSGIAAETGSAEEEPQIVLSTPNGVVDAGDAGIRAPKLFTAAVDVLGRDNIDVQTVIGAPSEAVVLSADVANVGDTAASAVNSVASTASQESTAAEDEVASESEAALGWLEVFLEGFGDEFCDPELDENCASAG